MSGGIQYYSIGKDAQLKLKQLSDELGMPDDNVNFLYSCIGDIEETIDALGTDENSEHYESEVSFRKALLKIKAVFEESAECIQSICDECGDILSELDDIYTNGEYDELFLHKYQEDSA